MAEKTSLSVLVYSPFWPVAQALVCLCRTGNGAGSFTDGAGVAVVEKFNDILLKINELKPDIVVLDISLRVNCGLLSVIRYYYPSLPVVVVQSRFLFSDRVVAEYFGHIWLKEYDALLAGYPALLLQEHLSNPGLAGTACGGNSKYHRVPRNVENTEFMKWEVEFSLRLRLYDLLKSPRQCEVVMDWLSMGVTPAQVGASLSRSSKVIYHYRGRVMRALNVNRGTRDFIPSVTVKIKQDERAW